VRAGTLLTRDADGLLRVQFCWRATSFSGGVGMLCDGRVVGYGVPWLAAPSAKPQAYGRNPRLASAVDLHTLFLLYPYLRPASRAFTALEGALAWT